MGVGKTDQGENRLHSMRKENPGQKPEKQPTTFFVVVEEERPTKTKKEMEEKEK